MTIFHTARETDGVPAPHDCELAPPRPRRYGFNGATKLLKINRDRERFHRWCGRNVNLSIAYTEDTWRILYKAFVKFETNLDWLQKDADARDQANTFADALR